MSDGLGGPCAWCGKVASADSDFGFYVNGVQPVDPMGCSVRVHNATCLEELTRWLVQQRALGGVALAARDELAAHKRSLAAATEQVAQLRAELDAAASRERDAAEQRLSERLGDVEDAVAGLAAGRGLDPVTLRLLDLVERLAAGAKRAPVQLHVRLPNATTASVRELLREGAAP